jgi:transcriptional regulator with XRE-family HTH domain
MLTAINISLLRQLYRISKKELAIKAGLSYSLITAIERGDRRLTEESKNSIRMAMELSDDIIMRINEIQAGLGCI